MNAHSVLIIGESEVAEGMVAIRPLDGGDQVRMPVADVIEYLKTKN